MKTKFKSTSNQLLIIGLTPFITILIIAFLTFLLISNNNLKLNKENEENKENKIDTVYVQSQSLFEIKINEEISNKPKKEETPLINTKKEETPLINIKDEETPLINVNNEEENIIE